MIIPKSIEELKQLIENEVQENIHLDYKASASLEKNDKKKDEIAKDVSAFANSDGGVIIYGIVEKDNLPVKIDEGVENKREWLEQIINSRISPTIDGVNILPIPVDGNKCVYVVEVPKSYRAPHQHANEKKYYKRFNFMSQPMEDYEIKDIRSRSTRVEQLVYFDIFIESSVFVDFLIQNQTNTPALDVEFNFSQQLVWSENDYIPPLFEKGIKYFPPKKTFRIRYRSFNEILNKKIPMIFDVAIKYFHPVIGESVKDLIHIDLNDYLYTIDNDTEKHRQEKKYLNSIIAISGEIKELNRHIRKISSTVSSTGFDLSMISLLNLKHILNGEGNFVRINPFRQDYKVFEELLQIDYILASKIEAYYYEDRKFEGLEKIEGMSKEVLDRFQVYFDCK